MSQQNNKTTGDPKSWNDGTVEWQHGGMVEWRKMIPDPKKENSGKWPQILKHGTAENDPES